MPKYCQRTSLNSSSGRRSDPKIIVRNSLQGEQIFLRLMPNTGICYLLHRQNGFLKHESGLSNLDSLELVPTDVHVTFFFSYSISRTPWNSVPTFLYSKPADLFLFFLSLLRQKLDRLERIIFFSPSAFKPVNIFCIYLKMSKLWPL